MNDRLKTIADLDNTYREAKKSIEAEIRRQTATKLTLLRAERDKEVYLARQEGLSIRKIAAALHTKATATAYEAIAAGAEHAEIVLDKEFAHLTGGKFIITPPRTDLTEFAAGVFNPGPQTSAVFEYDTLTDMIIPVDGIEDAEGRTNPVLKYVAQTKGYRMRAYDWAKENVGA
jgi:hypothetical protein